jgi:outer membrane protein assembly factor BamB
MLRLLVALFWLPAAGCGALEVGEVDPTQNQNVEADPARVAAATAAETPPATDGDWPGFRGAHRNGISTETGWKKAWPEQGLKRLWTAEVGLGYSAAAVAAGRVYTLGNRDARETVYAFDAETGRELWKYSYPCGLVDNLHPGGPGATPTIDGERVYTLSKEGHLHAFDGATGKVDWVVHLPKQLDVPIPEWGFTSSPLVLGERLILDVGGLIALDKSTGATVWRGNKYRAGYGSAVALKSAIGETLVAALTNDALVVVRSDDGREVANYEWTAQYATSGTTPVVCGKAIFISVGYDGGCALVELKGDKLEAPYRLETLYRNEAMSNHMATSILWQGRLYGIDGNSHTPRQCKLVCLDVATGKRLWEQRGFGCGSLTLVDGKLLVLSDEGRISLVAASPDGFKEEAKSDVGDGRYWTTPVLARGRIYCRSESGEFYCLDARL